MTRSALLLVVLATSACHREASISGRIAGWRNAPVGASGVDVDLRDDRFELVDTTITATDGSFTVTAPLGEEIHLVVSGPGLLPIAFGGDSGFSSTFEVPDGRLWAFRPVDDDGWRSAFEGCPGAADGAGMIVGATYLDLNTEYDAADVPNVPYGFAYVQPPDAEAGVDEHRACYLGDVEQPSDPSAYDPDATLTGVKGQFAIFGVQGGPWKFTVGRWVDGCQADGSACSLLGQSTVYVPDGGVVERWPALVPL